MACSCRIPEERWHLRSDHCQGTRRGKHDDGDDCDDDIDDDDDTHTIMIMMMIIVKQINRVTPIAGVSTLVVYLTIICLLIPSKHYFQKFLKRILS